MKFCEIAIQGVTVHSGSIAVHIGDVNDEDYRQLWDLEDYVVSSACGTVVFLVPRKPKGSMMYAPRINAEGKIVQNYTVVTPAYRDYKSAKEAKEAFASGKDWRMQPTDQLCSIRDFASGVTVNLRYGSNRKVTPFKVK